MSDTISPVANAMDRAQETFTALAAIGEERLSAFYVGRTCDPAQGDPQGPLLPESMRYMLVRYGKIVRIVKRSKKRPTFGVVFENGTELALHFLIAGRHLPRPDGTPYPWV